MMDELMRQETQLYFNQIVTLSEKGSIEWECTEYNPIGFLDRNRYSEQSACITQMFNFVANIGELQHELELAEYIKVPSGEIDIAVTLTRDDDMHFLKLDSILSVELDQQTESEPANINDVPVVRLAKYLVPIAAETEVVADAFEWARFINEKGISRTLLNNPLTKLGEKLCLEHRALDFHRVILDSAYREELLAQMVTVKGAGG